MKYRRLYRCELCQELTLDRQEHRASCRRLPVACTLCHALLPLEQMLDHLCPQQYTRLPLDEAGLFAQLSERGDYCNVAGHTFRPVSGDLRRKEVISCETSAYFGETGYFTWQKKFEITFRLEQCRVCGYKEWHEQLSKCLEPDSVDQGGGRIYHSQEQSRPCFETDFARVKVDDVH